MISGKVIGKEIDENGNIRVATEYTLTDGSKKVGHTRYDFRNFTEANVTKCVKTHCETIMKRTWGLKRHQELLSEIDLSNVEHECLSTEIVVKPAVQDIDGNITTPAETITIDDK